MSELEGGIRLDDVAHGDLPKGLDDSRVCYWRCPTRWWIYLPRAGLGDLSRHDVTEHEDRTITVKPSIGMIRTARKHGEGYIRHGFLTRGVWKEC